MAEDRDEHDDDYDDQHDRQRGAASAPTTRVARAAIVLGADDRTELIRILPRMVVPVPGRVNVMSAEAAPVMSATESAATAVAATAASVASVHAALTITPSQPA